MAFKHYDVVRAASPSDLAEKLTHKLKEGWQPFGSPVAITPYTLMQAIAAEGDVVVSGATEPEWYYVIVLAGQSNAMAYGEGLPLPDSYDAPHPRIKQLARRNTVTPGGEVPGFLFSMAEMCFMLFGRRISDFCTEWQVAVNLFRGRLYGKRWR